MYPLNSVENILTFMQCIHQMRQIHMGDATECIKSIGNALFAVFKAIFSNPNGLEMIMNNIFK